MHSDESFWQHEWEKHGTCAHYLNPKLRTFTEYAKKSLGLLEQLGVDKWLSAAKIKPGQSIDRETLRAAIMGLVRKKVYFVCLHYTGNRLQAPSSTGTLGSQSSLSNFQPVQTRQGGGPPGKQVKKSGRSSKSAKSVKGGKKRGMRRVSRKWGAKQGEAGKSLSIGMRQQLPPSGGPNQLQQQQLQQGNKLNAHIHPPPNQQQPQQKPQQQQLQQQQPQKKTQPKKVKRKSIPLLSEVRICLDEKTLTPIDCTRKDLSECGTGNIYFPSAREAYMGTIPGFP